MAGKHVDIDKLPVARRVAFRLKEKMQRQDYSPGQRLPTERELAEEFSANRSTIRAALVYLAEERLIVREPGCRSRVASPVASPPDVVRERAPGAGPRTIAAIVPQRRDHPALGLIQYGIQRLLRRRDAEFHLIVFDNYSDDARQIVALERRALAAVERDEVGGVMLCPMGGVETEEDIARLMRSGTPIVMLDRYPEGLACDFVGVDNRNAACDAVTYLLDLGHERIAHLTASGDLMNAREREAGYREALLARGLEPSERLICRLRGGDDLRPDVAPAVELFLSLPSPPTALFAMNDRLAHRFIAEMNRRGLRVPSDMSVMGFDDHDRHALQQSLLTTVHQPFEQMGERAADLLLRRLGAATGSRTPIRHLLLPAPVVVRESCARLRAP